MAGIMKLTVLAGLMIWITPAPASPQAADAGVGPRCEVARGPDGLMRGDRIPKGCVLRDEGTRDLEPAGDRDWTTPLGPCERYSERIFYTPTPKRSVLTNAARICRNLFERAAAGELSSEDGFGPVERHFEPVVRHFGPLDRRFEPIDRHFGPLDRRFEPLERPLGPIERPFGSQAGKPGARSSTVPETSAPRRATEAGRRGG